MKTVSEIKDIINAVHSALKQQDIEVKKIHDHYKPIFDKAGNELKSFEDDFIKKLRVYKFNKMMEVCKQRCITTFGHFPNAELGRSTIEVNNELDELDDYVYLLDLRGICISRRETYTWEEVEKILK